MLAGEHCKRVSYSSVEPIKVYAREFILTDRINSESKHHRGLLVLFDIAG